jgi:hypothetical protein
MALVSRKGSNWKSNTAPFDKSNIRMFSPHLAMKAEMCAISFIRSLQKKSRRIKKSRRLVYVDFRLVPAWCCLSINVASSDAHLQLQVRLEYQKLRFIYIIQLFFPQC